MGNEELSTIPEKESDEFIKSSVEDLIPIPRESEDTSGSDGESILPSSDDFSPIFEEKSVTFSNPLFDSNNDFSSSDDESLSDEDVPEDVKIYSNPLFEFDDEYISSGHYDHGSFGAFPSYEAKHRLEISFHVEKRISLRSRSKRAGGKLANESSLKFILHFNSSFVEFVQPYSEEFMNVFMRISFGSAIKLVSFDKSQVVTFNSKFVCGFRNSDYETRSRSDNMVDSPHGFIIH
ncbi:hypothetical protein Tco_1291934 [Tanacetum coccineum]